MLRGAAARAERAGCSFVTDARVCALRYSGVVTVVDPGELDVGLPPGASFAGKTSGWDMKVILQL